VRERTIRRKPADPVAAALLLIALLSGCGGGPDPSREILVFAAASTTNALTEIAAAFEELGGSDPAEPRGAIAVRFAFGASSDLARQIRAGAPADLFLSADLAQMRGLVEAGLVRSDGVRGLLSNQLVIAVPASSSLALDSPAGLLRVRRMALADPEAVPAGVYARQWLESIGLWSQLQPRIVPTVNVRAALAAVETASVDAGIVYRTDLATASAADLAYQVPAEEAPTIIYPIAPVAGSERPTDARAFIDFLTGSGARAVFQRHGFSVL
jgi:molybdate transport system substrate-binding protein